MLKADGDHQVPSVGEAVDSKKAMYLRWIHSNEPLTLQLSESLQESVESLETQVESIDTRKFLPEAVALLNAPASLDMTVRKSIIPLTRHRLYNNANSLSKSQSPSMFSSQSLLDLNSNTESITSDSFRLHCWNVFKSFATQSQSINPFDNCTLALPINMLQNVICQTIDGIDPNHVAKHIKKYHFEDHSMLCWVEFWDLANKIYCESNPKYSKLSRRSPLHLDSTDVITKTPSSPFQRLREKQRRVAHQEWKKPIRNDYLLHAATDTIQIDDNVIHAKFLATEVIEAVGRDSLTRKKKRDALG